ncbi:MAG: hypothetical protein ACYC6C_02005 [Coriobacteriia bacterium]
MTHRAKKQVPHVDASTLARFEAEQEDLDTLCADRELESDAIFTPDDWYGMAAVLKDYAGMPQNRSLKALVPHGVYFNDHHVIEYERQADLPVVLGYEQYRLPLYAVNGVVAIPFASPFCYANRLVHYTGSRRGTLYFPAHSTHWLTVETDWEALTDTAAALGSVDDPVSVVIYWRDYLLGHHVPFVKRGLRIVSAGHMFDQDFLLRLAYLLQTHSRAVTNALGGHVYYAAHAGCATRIIHQDYRVGGDTQALERDVPGFSDERWQVWRGIEQAFSVDTEAPTREQLSIVERHLSADRVLEPEELRSLLEWVDRLDRFGRAAWSWGTAPKAATESIGQAALWPFAWRRRSARLRLGIERLVSGVRGRVSRIRRHYLSRR